MMVGEEPGAPHDAILAVVVAVAAAAPFLLGGTEAVTEFISELFSPIGLLFLPVTLIFIIRFLSSDRGTCCLSETLSGGSPDSMRAGGSPLGVVLVLLLLLFLLYYRTSLNGGGGDDDSGE